MIMEYLGTGTIERSQLHLGQPLGLEHVYAHYSRTYPQNFLQRRRTCRAANLRRPFHEHHHKVQWSADVPASPCTASRATERKRVAKFVHKLPQQLFAGACFLQPAQKPMEMVQDSVRIVQ